MNELFYFREFLRSKFLMVKRFSSNEISHKSLHVTDRVIDVVLKFKGWRLDTDVSETRAVWLVLISLIALSISCNSKDGLFVSGNSTPVFEIRRGVSSEARVFPFLMLVQMHPDNVKLPPHQEDESKNRILWQITADPNSVNAANVETIERIEYGKVPEGFEQKVPQADMPPPALQENEIYEVIGPRSLMRNAVARFKIVQGKVEPLPTP